MDKKPAGGKVTLPLNNGMLPPRDVPLVARDSPSPLTEKAAVVELYTCDICGQESLPEAAMRAHVLQEHIEAGISCPFCDLEGTTLDEMNLHVNAVHLDYLSLHGSRTTSTVVVETATTSDAASSKSSSLASNASHAFSRVSASDGGSTSSGVGTSGSSSLRSDVTASTAPAPWGSTSEGEEEDEDSPTAEPSVAMDTDVVLHDISNVDASWRSGEAPAAVTAAQSLKRAKLRLNVTAESGTKPQQQQDSGQTGKAFACPMCPFGTNNPKEITAHVNAAHSDILSPGKTSPRQQRTLARQPSSPASLSSSKNDVSTASSISGSVATTSGCSPGAEVTTPAGSSTFGCPFCAWNSEKLDDLEAHVNAEHIDILSPGSPPPASPMSLGSASPQHACPVCGMADFSDTESLTLHVDGHFSAEQTPVLETADLLLAQELERAEQEAAAQQHDKEAPGCLPGRPAGKAPAKRHAERGLERAVYTGQLTITDYYSKKADIQHSNLSGVDDGTSCTKGIIPKLRLFYKTCSSVSQFWLASPMDHYAVSYEDKGWGCGYRNLQMLLSCLAHNPTYEQVLFNGRPLVPSIQKIQRLIEAAWDKGFDVQGCEQLGGSVVGTTKWIGATEIVATLSALKVKCQLVDFHFPSGRDGTHPRLFQWVHAYFRSSREFKPPLYLQHQGHSRTIVGVEEARDGGGLKLLIFDPSCSRRQMNSFVTGDVSAGLMRSLRRAPAALKAKQYQIVAVTGVLQDNAEYEDSKLLKSERIP